MGSLRTRLALLAQNLIYWGTPLVAFLLATLFYLRTYDSAMIKITAAQLGMAALAVFWIVKSIETGRLECPAPAGRILWPALLLLGWSLVSYGLSPYKIASLHGFVQFVLFLVAFCIGLLEFSQLSAAKRLIDWILAATWVAAVYGLIQWLDYRWFANDATSRGIDPFIWRRAFGYRIFSTLANPDLLAALLVGIYPLALASLLSSFPKHGPSLSTQEEVWYRKILLPVGSLRFLLASLLMPLLLFSLIYTWSMKGLVAFIPTMLLFALLSFRFLRAQSRRIALLVAGLSTLLVAGGLFLNSQKVKERFKYDAMFIKHTWIGTLDMIRHKPILGTGPGSFWVAYPEYRRPEIIRLEGRHNTETDHPENEVLEIWSELGIVGAALFLWLFWNIFQSTFVKLKKCGESAVEEDSIWLLGLFSSVMGFLFLGLTNALATRFTAPGLHFWLLAGTLGGVAATHLEKTGKFQVYPIPISIGFSRFLYLPLFAFMGFFGYMSVQWFLSDIKLNIAIYFSKQSEWDKAVAHYDETTPGYPAYVMAQYFKGNVFNDKGDLEKAVEQYQKVKLMAPYYVQVDHQLGMAYSKLTQWDKAIESFLAFENLDPLFEPNYRRLAWAYINKGDKAKASETLARFLSRFPDKKFTLEEFLKDVRKS